jgi:integrase
LTLGRPEDGWTEAKAERELAVVLRNVDLKVWRPPAPVAPPVGDPTFHEFASDWLENKRHEIRPNTVSSYRNDLTGHLLPFFKDHFLSQITIAEVDRYRNAKVRAGRLKPRSINMHLSLLAQILELAVEYGHIDGNPASGKRRRLKAPQPRPAYLDSAEHLAAMLEAATDLDRSRELDVVDPRGRRYRMRPAPPTAGRRAAVAVLMFAGLRASEVGALLWRDIDLANGRIYIGRAKTDAGAREIDLLPLLQQELVEHKTAAVRRGNDDPVFFASTGEPRNRHNLRQNVVAPIVKHADELLEERGGEPLPTGITPHKLRHTFASLLVALGNDPAYVMGQLGHTDPAFTLRVYTHMMRRDPGERDRLRARRGRGR